MAEPQPSGIQEGEQTPSAIPSSSEDRKAAAALSNLDPHVDDNAAVRDSDPEALGKAMKGLSVHGGIAPGFQKVDPSSKEPSKASVKLNPVDVTLLSEQLDLSKAKAMELLRAHDADVTKAIAAWIAVV